LSESLKGLTRVAHQPFVDDIHAALDHLRDAGFDVEEFRIPSSVMKRSMSGSYMGGSMSRVPVGDPYVDRDFLLQRINAVIGYFQMLGGKQDRPMGFRK
jgi:hypothetical protein